MKNNLLVVRCDERQQHVAEHKLEILRWVVVINSNREIGVCYTTNLCGTLIAGGCKRCYVFGIAAQEGHGKSDCCGSSLCLDISVTFDVGWNVSAALVGEHSALVADELKVGSVIVYESHGLCAVCVEHKAPARRYNIHIPFICCFDWLPCDVINK